MDHFDWEKYINTYKDLQEAGLNSKKKAWNHWITFGQKEGRICNFDLQQDAVRIINEQYKNNNTIVNLIGITDIICSISDNLYMMGKYMEKTYKVNIINYKNIKRIVIDNSQKYIFCLQPFEMNDLIWFLQLFDSNNKPEVLWIWEFKSIPYIFNEYENYFSKIYVQSKFCYDCFLSSFKIPIEKIHLQPKIYNLIDQVYNYNIKNENIINLLEKTRDKIKFGYCFDLNSSIFRKNVLNLLLGFINLNRDDVVLILKFRQTRNNIFVNSLEKDQYIKVMNLIDNKKIFHINEELSDLELYKLYTNFDYYISPHVSEGYGLTIHENLLLGVKIISTFYSGEKDFLIPGCFTELSHEEKEIDDLREHPIYGQMSSFLGAYVSSEVIKNTLEYILGDGVNYLVNNEQVNNEQVNNEQVNNEQVNNDQFNNNQVNNEQVNNDQLTNEQGIPPDVFYNYLFADENYLIVKDPKHTNECYHYTIWSKNEIINIFDINNNCLENLNKFVDKVTELNLFDNDKKYFTYPPTHNRLHLHIVPKNYISYRPKNELYDFEEFGQIFINIGFIYNINKQKENSINLELRFNLGIIVLTNFYNLEKLSLIKESENLDYIIIIRNKHTDNFIETLILNNKLINVHLISKNLNNYFKIIKYDKLVFL
jgi:hypothetical protein